MKMGASRAPIPAPMGTIPISIPTIYGFVDCGPKYVFMIFLFIVEMYVKVKP